MPKPTPLQKLQYQAEDEGYEVGSPQYELRVLALRVEKCLEMQGAGVCSDCRAYVGCELTRDYARTKTYGPK